MISAFIAGEFPRPKREHDPGIIHKDVSENMLPHFGELDVLFNVGGVVFFR